MCRPPSCADRRDHGCARHRGVRRTPSYLRFQLIRIVVWCCNKMRGSRQLPCFQLSPTSRQRWFCLERGRCKWSSTAMPMVRWYRVRSLERSRPDSRWARSACISPPDCAWSCPDPSNPIISTPGRSVQSRAERLHDLFREGPTF